MPSVATANPVVLILRNRKERLRVTVTEDGVPVTPESLELVVQDLSDRILHRDAFPSFRLTGTLSVAPTSAEVTGVGTGFTTEVRPGDTLTLGSILVEVAAVQGDTRLRLTSDAGFSFTGEATKTTRIVNPTTGVYYIDWGDPAAAANLTSAGQVETAQPGTVLFVWEVTDSAGDLTTVVQTACIVTANTLSLLPGFRALIDKSVKLVDGTDDCFLGYTDSQLIGYLEQGLSIINAYEPYPVFNTLDQFPRQFLYVLYESALVAGVMSQQLFAIDTDIPQFSDQGNTFVIQHGPQLANVLNQITARLDKIIPRMKYKFVQTGSLHIQAGTNFRIAQLIGSAPNGALFRNVFFRGN